MTTIINAALNPGTALRIAEVGDLANLSWHEGNMCTGVATYNTADLLAALDATANTDVKIRADVYAKLTEAEAELRATQRTNAALREEVEKQTARAEKAEAGSRWAHRELAKADSKLADAERTLTELAPAEVCVEGSWFKPVDLPAVLGNHMRAATELARKAKAAEAKLARVRELLENADADDLKIRFYNRLQKAIADAPQFVLPTEVPARIIAVKSSTGDEKELTLFTDGDTTWWADIEDWGPFWTRSQVMDQFTNHRLIEAAG